MGKWMDIEVQALLSLYVMCKILIKINVLVHVLVHVFLAIMYENPL